METIKYALRGVSIEQFATPFEPSTEKKQFNLNIPIRTNYQERTIAVGTNIQFLEEEKPFIIAEVFCHFIIEETCWNNLTENGTKDAVLPKGFVNNLVRIAISTSRGALCAKTENTPFSKFFLPVIEIQENQGEDITIPMPSRSNEQGTSNRPS